MSYFVETVWPPLLVALHVIVSLSLSIAILLRRHEGRAAVAWLDLIWPSPFVGGLIYLLFGINRIERRAARLRPGRRDATGGGPARGTPLPPRASLPADKCHLEPLIHLIEGLTAAPLMGGNSVTPLVNGEAAYPEMLAAIEAAEKSVALSTYIFNGDAAGRPFVEALDRALDRGIEIRVLIDGIGSLYGRPSILGTLRRRQIPSARFLFSLVPWRMSYLNLRNHQKILVVDGRVGFTGGMNIKAGHLLAGATLNPT